MRGNLASIVRVTVFIRRELNGIAKTLFVLIANKRGGKLQAQTLGEFLQLISIPI